MDLLNSPYFWLVIAISIIGIIYLETRKIRRGKSTFTNPYRSEIFLPSDLKSLVARMKNVSGSAKSYELAKMILAHQQVTEDILWTVYQNARHQGPDDPALTALWRIKSGEYYTGGRQVPSISRMKGKKRNTERSFLGEFFKGLIRFWKKPKKEKNKQ